MRVRLVLVLMLAAAGLQACERYEPASPERIARAAYVHEAPPSITLITMVSNATGRGAHSALLINGTQRVLYDPAGTFFHPDLPRREDVHYGMTPRFYDYYLRYHARFSHHVHAQTLEVPLAVAEIARARAEAEGKTLKAHCAIAVGRVLSGVPGFEDFRPTWFPSRLRARMAARAGVVDRFEFGDEFEQVRVWEAAVRRPTLDRVPAPGG